MRLNRHQLRRLISEQYQILNEAAQNWNQYIEAGKTPESKEKRKKIKLRWEQVGGNKTLYPPDEVKSPASPAKFSNDYTGWTKWYFACIKDPGAMKLIGRQATYPKGENNGHISPDEMLATYAAMIPPSKLDVASKMAKTDSDKKMVDDFMAGLDFGDAGMSQSQIASLGKTPAEKMLDTLTQLNLEQGDSRAAINKSPEEQLKGVSDGRPQQSDPKIRTQEPTRAERIKPLEMGPAGKSQAPQPPWMKRRKKKLKESQVSQDYLRNLIREALQYKVRK